jgi:hypothetical protein
MNGGEKDAQASQGTIDDRLRWPGRLDGQQTSPAVLWTDGVKFHEILSAPLKNILQLEKVYRY